MKVPINSIKPNPNNPRVLKNWQYEKLKKSITEFPKMLELRPIVVDDDGIILGGNMRYRILQELKYKEVEIVRASELTEEEKKRFIITDNVSFGEWDNEVLANEWDVELLSDWGLDLDFTKTYGDSNAYNLKTDLVGEGGDGVIEKLGYNGASIWVDMPREIEGLSDRLIELPLMKKGANATNISKGVKYSRTTPEEIRRIVVTYMEQGDFFLENTCGWSTFGGIAKMHGYSGIGVDIWDVALAHSKRQVESINVDGASVEIIEADGMQLPFEDNKFDYVYCNPPFLDVELYSEKENEIANKDPKVYESNLLRLVKENYRVLKKGRLCTMTISDYRQKGVLVPMGNMLVNAGLEAGFKLHDYVVSEVMGLAMVLRKKSVEKKRTAKTHEYVITFIKQ